MGVPENFAFAFTAKAWTKSDTQHVPACPKASILKLPQGGNDKYSEVA